MDLAEAHIAALQFIQLNKPQIISTNIGTGKGYSVLDVIKTYSRVNCVYLPYKFSGRREGDAPFLVADNYLALKLLEWEPKKNMDDEMYNILKRVKHLEILTEHAHAMQKFAWP